MELPARAYRKFLQTIPEVALFVAKVPLEL